MNRPAGRDGARCSWRALVRALSGRPGRSLVAAVLVAYGALALGPFRWAPPRLVQNAAVTDGEGVRFPGAGLAYSAMPPDWLGRAAALGRFRLHLHLRTYAVEQDGPARIFTISRDLHLANLVLGQDGSALVLRLRRPGSTPAGKPAYVVPDVFRDTGWHDIDIAIAPGRLGVTVDGRPAIDTPLPDRPLAGWHHGHRVAMGSELNGLRGWRGAVGRAVVEIDDTRIDYASVGALIVPDRFWAFANRPTWLWPDELAPESVTDWAANFASFVVLGFLLGALNGPRGSWRRAALVCAVASLSVELAQALFSRHPALMDWILNTLGGAAGAGIARGVVRRAAASARGACLRPHSLRVARPRATDG